MCKHGKARIVNLDLRCAETQALVSQWCTDPHCVWVHFGTPCGTASKAPSMRMSKHSHGPPPLRSRQFALGLPTISGTNLARVRSANVLYNFTCRLIRELDALGTIWFLENPWSSLLWETPYWKATQKQASPYMVELDFCMFGGRREKHTALATNCVSLLELNILCDSQHEHAPWTYSNGKFATAEEAEYPNVLCKRLATCVFYRVAKLYNFPDPVERASQLKASHFPPFNPPSRCRLWFLNLLVCLLCRTPQTLRLFWIQSSSFGRVYLSTLVGMFCAFLRALDF